MEHRTAVGGGGGEGRVGDGDTGHTGGTTRPTPCASSRPTPSPPPSSAPLPRARSSPSAPLADTPRGASVSALTGSPTTSAGRPPTASLVRSAVPTPWSGAGSGPPVDEASAVSLDVPAPSGCGLTWCALVKWRATPVAVSTTLVQPATGHRRSARHSRTSGVAPRGPSGASPRPTTSRCCGHGAAPNGCACQNTSSVSAGSGGLVASGRKG
jgi:hypothetical protein